jgi:glycosyltransferase involved in cell wall biosynthesis
MTSNKLTLTIVIPVYNEENHLKACLQSIAAQTVKPDEVIVVDNNSTDRTVAIAKKYKFVKVLYEKRQGIAYARNKGFNAAKGSIIGRIDADTRLLPDWVAYAKGYLSSHPNELLTGGCYMYDLKAPRLFGWVQGQIAFRANRIIMGHYIAWGTNMALPKKLWQAVKKELHNDPDIHEDMDLAIHLHRRGYQITYHADWKVGADMRLYSRHTRDQHMKYLKMWPRTLYKHNLRRAWLGWVGVYVVYSSYTPLFVVNKLAGRRKKSKVRR